MRRILVPGVIALLFAPFLLQAAGGIAGHRRTNDAAGMADHECQLVGRRMFGRKDQVAFVLAVVVVGDDDDFAALEGANCFNHPLHIGRHHRASILRTPTLSRNRPGRGA